VLQPFQQRFYNGLCSLKQGSGSRYSWKIFVSQVDSTKWLTNETDKLHGGLGRPLLFECAFDNNRTIKDLTKPLDILEEFVFSLACSFFIKKKMKRKTSFTRLLLSLHGTFSGLLLLTFFAMSTMIFMKPRKV